MGDDENIVTTFYVEGEVSLCWDRETGEFVSLYMNSILNDDWTDAHTPLSSSVVSSSYLKSGFDLWPSDSDDRECLHSTSLADQDGVHMCVLKRAESSRSLVDIDPLKAAPSNCAAQKSSTEAVKLSVPVAAAMPRGPLSTTIHSSPTHELVSAKGLWNPNAIQKSSSVKLPFVPIQSTHNSKLEKTESVDRSSGSVLPSSAAAKQKQAQTKANCGSSSADKKEKTLTQIPSLNKEPSGAPVNGLSVDRVSFVSHLPVTRSSSAVKDTVVSPHPATNHKILENMSKNIPMPKVDSSHPPPNQKALRNVKENNPVPLWQPTSPKAQSLELGPFPVTRPNLSPWFSTLNTSSGVSQVFCNSPEKPSSDTTTTSHSSIDRTGHEEPSTRLSETSPASSTHIHTAHCLRLSCKDGNCRANLTPSLEKSSTNGTSTSLSSIERSGQEEPFTRSSDNLRPKDGNHQAYVTPSSEKSSTDSMQTFCSSAERTGLQEPSAKLLEKNHPVPVFATDSQCSYCLRSSCKDGNCRANLIPSSPSSGKTAMNVLFAPSRTDEVSKPATAIKNCESSLATTKAPKQANDWGSKTAPPIRDAHSRFLSTDSHSVRHDEKAPISPLDEKKACLTPLSIVDEPVPPPPTTERPGVKATLQWLMDYTKNTVSEINDAKPEVSLSEKLRKNKKGKDANKISDFEATFLSSNEDGTLLFSPVEENPTKYISSLPLPFSETWTSLPLDSDEEKPAFLNSFMDPARLADFANAFLSLPAAVKQETDLLTPIDSTKQKSMKSGKRSRDAASSPTYLLAKKVDQTSPTFSSGDMYGTQTISSVEKTSPISTRPSTAKSNKRPRVGDLSSSKGLIPKGALHAPSNKAEKRPRECDSSLLKVNAVAIASPSEQPELTRSSHQSHSPRKGGKSSRNLRDAYSGHRNKRRKTFQLCLGPMDCCRPRNAFILYSMKERQRIAAAHPHAQFGEISKLVASSWHNMSDAEKKPYRKLASEEANRYHKEVCKSHQTWEHLASRGLQILYVVDLVCDWLSQKLPKWAKYLSRSSIGLSEG